MIIETLPWFERKLKFGHDEDMLPLFLERLSGSPLRAEAKVKGVSDEILSKRLNGKWSIKENIGHLAEVDIIANKRLEEIVKGVEFMSKAVFEPKDYTTWPIQDVLDLFMKNRGRNLERYKSLSMKELKKQSLHPRLKVWMTPIDLAYFDAEHDDHHLVKVNNILALLNSK
jgi:hypothetical protein